LAYFEKRRFRIRIESQGVVGFLRYFGYKSLCFSKTMKIILMISEFNRFFSSRTLASTYKPTFLKCLLDIGDCKQDEGKKWVTEGNTFSIDLNFVAARFLRYYWPLLFKFKLRQEATEKPIVVYKILKEYEQKIGVKSTPTRSHMCSDEFIQLRKDTIKKGIRPQVLKKLLNDCNIYTIQKNSILLKKEIVDFMRDNKKTLESALNHVIAQYLEGINSAPNISRKLEERLPRTTLKNIDFDEIKSMQNHVCFYCEKKPTKFVQEHFVPWNFIYSTSNFNIVASCVECNSSKNDKLATAEYVKKILQRNTKLKKLQYGYSSEYFKNLYDSCLRDYHGVKRELWHP